MRPNNITLIGFMGSGKSSVSRSLKSYYPDFTLADCDSLIETRAGKSISDIFSDEGEDVFRGLEALAIGDVLKKEKTIVATGGGAILRESNRLAMTKQSWVIWLTASPHTIYERIKHEYHRPLISTGADRETIIYQIQTILYQRFDLYRDTMDIMINTDEQTPDTIAKAINEELERLQTCLTNG